jgi:hypothetical protein
MYNLLHNYDHSNMLYSSGEVFHAYGMCVCDAADGIQNCCLNICRETYGKGLFAPSELQ